MGRGGSRDFCWDIPSRNFFLHEETSMIRRRPSWSFSRVSLSMNAASPADILAGCAFTRCPPRQLQPH